MQIEIAGRVPQYVKTVIGALERAGHRGYLVGGSLRDLLLAKKPHDFDLTTDATPEEMLEIYYNSQQFCHTILLLEDRFPDPLSLYEALAGFWREQGAWNRPVSRPERLELLRIFAHRTDPSRSAQYDRALLTDLYQREKAKSRPCWAPDLGPFRQKIRMFYETEVREHRYTDTAREEKSSSLAHHSHLEPVLSGPSWDLSGDPPEWMLFDYSRMDPVTGNARIVHIKL